LLVLIGAVCTFILLERARSIAADLDTVSDCYTQAAVADTAKLRLKDPSRVTTAEEDRLFGYFFTLVLSHLSPLVFIPLAFGALSCLLTIKPPLSAPPPASFSTSLSAAQEIRMSKETTSSSFLPDLRSVYISVRSVVSGLTPFWFAPVLVVNELFLLKDWSSPNSIPEGEKMYEVGQWGLFVCLGLVTAAAGVNWLAGRRYKKEKKGRKRMMGEEVFVV
jgi:hypothetical protein